MSAVERLEKPRISQGRLIELGRGLSEAEVRERRLAGEVNDVARGASRSYARIVRQNLFTFLNLLIFAIAGLLLALGLFVDAAMTATLATANVSVALVQEVRTKRKLDRIALLTRPVATVLREGRERQIDVESVVRGDLLVARPGDQIVVDGEVQAVSGANVDESLLTGESELVSKSIGDTVYSGSFCMAGLIAYEARVIGPHSLAERLSAVARAFRDERTPMQSELIRLMRWLLVAILALSLLVANTFNRLYADFPINEAARAASVMVGLVPQGLVLMVAITAAMAIIRLAGRGALVQRMNAIESFSHVDTLCLDKTGTITSNALQVESLRPLGAPAAELSALLGSFVASVSVGNRTSDAVAQACLGEPFSVRGEVQFSSSYKWSALSTDDLEYPGTYVLGAPDVLRPAIDTRNGAIPGVDELAAEGQRVLLFAFHPDPDILRFDAEGEPQLPLGIQPLGLVALSEQLRPDAAETLSRFQAAGVDLKFISGDHPATVAALLAQIGVEARADGRIVSGADLDGIDRESFDDIARNSTIFGRVTPHQKAQLIDALRRDGCYVAMIGDGVNDVPALKQSNVALAMRSGSEAARSIADVILVDDAFTVLPGAFREGQRIRDAMKSSMELFLNRTFYTMLIIFFTALSGVVFPVALRHGVLVAAITVGIPAFALAAWARPGMTSRRLLPSVFETVVPAAVSIAAVGLAIYQFFLRMTGDVVEAQTALTATTMLCGLAYVVFLRPPSEAWTGAATLSGDFRPIRLAAGLLLAYFAIALVPPLRAFFDLRTLPISGYAIILLVTIGWAASLRLVWRLRVTRAIYVWLRSH